VGLKMMRANRLASLKSCDLPSRALVSFGCAFGGLRFS
jgi:hypothetical protein